MTTTTATWSRISLPDAQGQTNIEGGKIYILPTRVGMIFAVALTTMLLGSLNYVSNIGLAFTFLFGSLALVGMVHTWRNLLNVHVKVLDAAPIFLGQPTTFTVRLSEHRGLERAAIVVAVDSNNTKSLWGNKGVATDLPVDLPANSNADVELTPVPTQRGKFHLGTLCIASAFPLGLFRAWAYVQTDATVLVYPTPKIVQKWHPTMRFVPALQGGGRGVGVEDFVGMRPYRVGDSLKHLDWKSLAKERGPITRQFGGDRHEEIWLDWEAVGPGNTEERLSKLCRLILDAVAMNISYGLRLPNGGLPSASGDAHKHRCLALLATFPGDAMTIDTSTSATPLNPALTGGRSFTPPSPVKRRGQGGGVAVYPNEVRRS